MTGPSDPPKPAAATGGCECGAVRYEVRGPLRSVVNCHCGQCRRIHGHFAAYSAAMRGDLAVVEARGLKWYRSSDKTRRGFCGICGASLFWDAEGRDYIAVAAGTLTQPTGLTTSGHIFVADKGDYYEISDDLPRWPGFMSNPVHES